MVSTSRSKAMAFQRPKIAEVTTPMPAQPMEDVKVSMESTRTKMAYAPELFSVIFQDFMEQKLRQQHHELSNVIWWHLFFVFYFFLCKPGLRPVKQIDEMNP